MLLQFVFLHLVTIIYLGLKHARAAQCGTDGKIFVNVWVVEFDITAEAFEISAISEEHGFIHYGEVLPGTNLHEFSHPELEECSNQSADAHTAVLVGHPKVKSSQQQVISWRKLTSHEPENNITVYDPYWSRTWNLNRGIGSDAYDMNVIPAWQSNYTGRGVVVTVVDTGIQTDHPDLHPNYDPLASRDVVSRDSDPTPHYSSHYYNDHGTRCAGVIASAANNSYCSVGIAHSARIGAILYLDGSSYTIDSMEARAFSFNRDYIDIYSNSWGTRDNSYVRGPDTLANLALKEGVSKGRKGKGSIYVFAAGNGGSSDSCSCNGYVSSIYTISVGAANQYNRQVWYGEDCPAIIVATYSGGYYKKIVTTDLNSQCTTQHSGTSAAAPQASGIIALALEANPELTWRDVQYLIIHTANPEPLLTSGEFNITGAGRKVSHKFGYGLMDGKAMVDAALTWKRVPPQLIFKTSIQQPYALLSYYGRYSQNITIPPCPPDYTGCIHHAEHIQLVLTVSATKRGGLSIILRSPSGTNSTLLKRRSYDYTSTGFSEWPFMSLHYWGENPAGNWTFFIDTGGHTGTLFSYHLVVYGAAIDPYNPGDYVYHNFTCDSTCDNLAGCTGSGPSQCIACNTTYYKVEDTHLCVSECEAGYYADNTTEHRLCKRCDRSCASCTDSGDSSCTSCVNGTYLDARYNSCLVACPDTFFAEYENSTCLPCQPGCHSCTSLSDCVICDDGSGIVNGGCKLVCAESEYRDQNDDCRPCTIPSCELCKNAAECLRCNANTTKYHQGCVSKCPNTSFIGTSTYIVSQSECFDCDAHCKTCYGPAEDNCLSCQEEYMVSYSHLCIRNSTCPLGQFRELGLGDCKDCDKSCKSCSGASEMECLACQEGRFLFHGSCVTACGDRYYNLTDTINPSCQLCDPSCLTCTGPSASQCTACLDEGAKLHKDLCVSPCPAGQFQLDSVEDSTGNLTCENCSSECSSCSGPLAYQCSSCVQGLALTPDGYCVKDCLPGFYKESAIIDHLVCLSCNELCKTCSGESARHCLSCDEDRLLYQNQCVLLPKCYENQYYDNPNAECRSCHATCSSCDGVGDADCTRCPDDSALYILTNTTLRRTQKSGQCLPCCISDVEAYDKCCSCDGNNEGLSCVESKDTSQNGQPNQPSAGVTAGTYIGVTIAVIAVIILAVIGYRYRRYGRCVWPNICMGRGLSIMSGDVLSHNTECEMGSSNSGTLAFKED